MHRFWGLSITQFTEPGCTFETVVQSKISFSLHLSNFFPPNDFTSMFNDNVVTWSSRQSYCLGVFMGCRQYIWWRLKAELNQPFEVEDTTNQSHSGLGLGSFRFCSVKQWSQLFFFWARDRNLLRNSICSPCSDLNFSDSSFTLDLLSLSVFIS